MLPTQDRGAKSPSSFFSSQRLADGQRLQTLEPFTIDLDVVELGFLRVDIPQLAVITALIVNFCKEAIVTRL
ncbi:hypothetical protein [Caballeronia novacaledonica]|uniref:Uncharacterized protein n=1 Tax=Caballeronia novacaledonica TaxID=1544861 RepID=A0AA37IGT0_9BURK|nr:hypothetical protein [Caballeronia novacaledonica]GJH28927.1 hypothetical protein CBA19CS42_30445 [Caballeronia novacaledonica]